METPESILEPSETMEPITDNPEFVVLVDEYFGFTYVYIKPFTYIPSYYSREADDSNNIPQQIKDELTKFKSDSLWLFDNINVKCSDRLYSLYNREWRCCGFYAPHLYYALVMGSLRFFVKQRASLFYKYISGYGNERNWHVLDTKSWNTKCLKWHDFSWVKNKISGGGIGSSVVANTIKPHSELEPDTVYIFNMIGREIGSVNLQRMATIEPTHFPNYCKTYHHMVVKRLDTYVIIADTWCWGDTYGNDFSRLYNIRAMLYEEFVMLVDTINKATTVEELNHAFMFGLFAPYGSDKTPILNKLVYLVPMRKKVLDKIVKYLEVEENRETVRMFGGKKRRKRKVNKTRKNNISIKYV